MIGPRPLADGALVINLDERSDRWRQFTSESQPLLGSLHVERIPAIKGVELAGFGEAPFFRGRKRDRTWAGRAGCTLSHRAAIETARDAGWQRVLILEDDVEIEADFSNLVSPLSEALERVEWGVCYLGFTDPIGPFQEHERLTKRYTLARVYGCNTTHAYLVHARAYPFLLDALPDPAGVWHWLTRKRAIDRWYARTLSSHMSVLAVTPSAVNQQDSVSDITGRAYEKAHTTSVPAGRTGTHLQFQLMRALRAAHFGISGAYDEVRGLIKRIRGF